MLVNNCFYACDSHINALALIFEGGRSDVSDDLFGSFEETALLLLMGY
jgi:hypothetical protein